MKRTSFCCSLRKSRRLFTSSNVSVPSCFLVYPIIPPSYFALTVCGAGAGAVLLLGEESTFRGRCAYAPVARAPNRSRMALNLMLLSPSTTSDGQHLICHIEIFNYPTSQ